MKKFLSLVLAMLMVFGVTASLADDGADLLAITTEEITLRYATMGEDYELTLDLAEQFMQAYPNIKVEIVEIDTGTYTEGLGNLAAEQKLPDVFWMENVCDAVGNDWALRLDDYYTTDPDAARMDPALLKMAQIAGRRYSIPAQTRPMMVVVNKTLFDKYNVELPGYDWTWEEFVQVCEAVAHPEDYYFGYGNNTTIEYFYNRHGWDGDSYEFDETWVMLEETFANWRETGVADNMTAEEKEKILGDPNGFAAANGRVAVNGLSFIWGGAAYLDGSTAQETGCEYLLYPVPSPMEGNPDETIFACISKGTKYPNEAWLLGKWMTWGREATMLRNVWFEENEVVQNSVPMLTDEDLWQHTIDHGNPGLADFYANFKGIAPRIDPHAPNIIWCNVMFYFGGVPDSFANGTATPADRAPSLREEMNGYRDNWYRDTSEFGAVPEFLQTATATDLDVTTGTDAE